MMKGSTFLTVLLVLGLTVAMVASCDKEESSSSDDTASEGSGGEQASTNQPTEQASGGGQATAEQAPATGGRGGGGSCDAYAKCCTAYANALGKVQGIPETAVKATQDSCKQIDSLKATPTGDSACQQALDGMKQGAAAYKAMPGFEWPSECQ